MKYAHIKENGQLLGWYDKDIHASIPTPNIEVSKEAWQNAINNNHNKVNADGTTEFFDFRTDEEIAKQELEAKIAEAKAYLASTDYVVTKIMEYTLLNKDISLLVVEYSEILQKRDEYRSFLNNLTN